MPWLLFSLLFLVFDAKGGEIRGVNSSFFFSLISVAAAGSCAISVESSLLDCEFVRR